MHPTPRGGNADNSENKGLAGKAIRKTMKTKGRQTQAQNKVCGGLRRYGCLAKSLDLLERKVLAFFEATKSAQQDEQARVVVGDCNKSRARRSFGEGLGAKPASVVVTRRQQGGNCRSRFILR